jgi:hypothetical protein
MTTNEADRLANETLDEINAELDARVEAQLEAEHEATLREASDAARTLGARGGAAGKGAAKSRGDSEHYRAMSARRWYGRRLERAVALARERIAEGAAQPKAVAAACTAHDVQWGDVETALAAE